MIYNNDCLELLPKLKDKSIDFIFTDLPYGTTRNNWDTVIPLDVLWKEFNRIIKDNGCIALWCQEPFTTQLILSNQKMFRYKWIIEKTNPKGFLNANRMPLRSYEEIAIFYKHLPTYNPQKTSGHKRKISKHSVDSEGLVTGSNYGKYSQHLYDSTERYPRDIVTFSWDNQTGNVHPTQKPVVACEYFIKTYTDEGDTVLDCCMGSGSTGIACLHTNRRFIGIEKEKEYFDIAENRIKKEMEN